LWTIDRRYPRITRILNRHALRKGQSAAGFARGSIDSFIFLRRIPAFAAIM